MNIQLLLNLLLIPIASIWIKDSGIGPGEGMTTHSTAGSFSCGTRSNKILSKIKKCSEFLRYKVIFTKSLMLELASCEVCESKLIAAKVWYIISLLSFCNVWRSSGTLGATSKSFGLLAILQFLSIPSIPE